jgi:hypothetical protein
MQNEYKYYISTYSSRGYDTGRVYGNNKKNLADEVCETRMPWLSKRYLMSTIRLTTEGSVQ